MLKGTAVDYPRYEKSIQKTRGYLKTLRQSEFEKAHPEICEIYNHIDEFLDQNQLNQEKEKDKSKVKNEDTFSKYKSLYN